MTINTKNDINVAVTHVVTAHCKVLQQFAGRS